jgi:hypothetical protein
MKYKVIIPKPIAKPERYNSKTLIISFEDGWGQNSKTIHSLNDEEEFDIDIPDDIEYVGESKCLDGMTFDVSLEYSNPTGTRKEYFRLVPQKV